MKVWRRPRLVPLYLCPLRYLGDNNDSLATHLLGLLQMQISQIALGFYRASSETRRITFMSPSASSDNISQRY